MRIADSTVNMLSGRNYTQTGMRSGSGYTNGFMGCRLLPSGSRATCVCSHG